MYIFNVVHSKGNYQGNDYDNIKFLCLDDITPKNLLAGEPVYTLKVKTSIVIDTFGKSIESIDWVSLIGAEILPTFNRYGQPVSLSISYVDGGSASMLTTDEGPVPIENPEAPPVEDFKDKKPKNK